MATHPYYSQVSVTSQSEFITHSNSQLNASQTKPGIQSVVVTHSGAIQF